MQYSVDKSVINLCPNIQFGILIGENINNSNTSISDQNMLRIAEENLRKEIPIDQLKQWHNISLYRDIMQKAGINPNKFPTSVEAMLKRILKNGTLPTINALVDLCNVVSINNIITLGAHDLSDINDDLEVRFTTGGEQFLPFGKTEYETVEKGELVFTSGNIVQTRKWIWRQSDFGKISKDSNRIFFQLVGFEEKDNDSFNTAMTEIEDLIVNRFKGSCTKYIVNSNLRSISF